MGNYDLIKYAYLKSEKKLSKGRVIQLSEDVLFPENMFELSSLK